MELVEIRMKRHMDYKVPGGKLIRIDLETEQGIIKDIRITGDFFIHPEESILTIENSLKGIHISEVPQRLERIITKNRIKLIGLRTEDIIKIINSVNE